MTQPTQTNFTQARESQTSQDIRWLRGSYLAQLRAPSRRLSHQARQVLRMKVVQLKEQYELKIQQERQLMEKEERREEQENATQELMTMFFHS